MRDDLVTHYRVLYTRSTALKFVNAVAKAPCKLSLSYYSYSTFLPRRINEPTMGWIGATVPKNQPLRALWRPFVRLKTTNHRYQPNSLVTQELIPLLHVESITRSSSTSVGPVLCYSLINSFLQLNIFISASRFFDFFHHTLCVGVHLVFFILYFVHSSCLSNNSLIS